MNRGNILKFIGLARKAGKLVAGRDASLNAAARGDAKIAIVAVDAAPGAAEKFIKACSTARTEVLVFGTREELGFHIGRVDCTIIAITDNSFARRIREMINCGQEGRNTRGCGE